MISFGILHVMSIASFRSEIAGDSSSEIGYVVRVIIFPFVVVIIAHYEVLLDQDLIPRVLKKDSKRVRGGFFFEKLLSRRTMLGYNKY